MQNIKPIFAPLPKETRKIEQRLHQLHFLVQRLQYSLSLFPYGTDRNFGLDVVKRKLMLYDAYNEIDRLYAAGGLRPSGIKGRFKHYPMDETIMQHSYGDE